MAETVTIELGLDELEDEGLLRQRVARAAGIAIDALGEIDVLKRSLDARRGRVRFHLLVALGREHTELALPHPIEVSGEKRVVIVGDGPAGLFCAYQLARVGIPSVVIDRGKQVQPRRRDLKGLNQHGVVDPDSNYCFGEGGAGTYSDGKLYTRSHKRGDVRDVIEVLAVHGAPERILCDARPHIGSNRLPVVVTAMRERLEACGVDFRFGARVTDLVRRGQRVIGVRDHNGNEYLGDAVVLATGHSARDMLAVLDREQIALEAKAFALGVRIEHPQPLINQIQYGSAAGHPALPAAAYKLARHIDDRGVFSFCMCPGGWIVPASTTPGALVVNGMSLSRRDSPFANSGLVVGIEPEDVAALGYPGVLGGLDLQTALETSAFVAGGGTLVAPATRVTDFLKGSGSTTTPATSYLPGLNACNLEEVLNVAGGGLVSRLRRGLQAFGGKLRGYVTEEAILVGVESRTSSPVRVLRHSETLVSPSAPGLYPCGEGAGYAGGIVSAAMDGMRVARAIAAELQS